MKEKINIILIIICSIYLIKFKYINEPYLLFIFYSFFYKYKFLMLITIIITCKFIFILKFLMFLIIYEIFCFILSNYKKIKIKSACFLLTFFLYLCLICITTPMVYNINIVSKYVILYIYSVCCIKIGDVIEKSNKLFKRFKN